MPSCGQRGKARQGAHVGIVDDSVPSGIQAGRTNRQA